MARNVSAICSILLAIQRVVTIRMVLLEDHVAQAQVCVWSAGARFDSLVDWSSTGVRMREIGSERPVSQRSLAQHGRPASYRRGAILPLLVRRILGPWGLWRWPAKPARFLGGGGLARPVAEPGPPPGA